MKIVIVGGVAGGATACARLRRLDENAQILLFEKGEYVSFANCGLPYYIGKEIVNRDNLFVATKESIEAKYNVDIRTLSEVIEIIPDRHVIVVKDLATSKTYEESYDKLILSTGSSPFIPPIEGRDFPNVFRLWNITDTDAIYHFIEEKKPKKAVVVGAGFIGIEMVENLSARGIQVSLVEKMDQVMPPFDKDMAKLIENHLHSKSVSLYLQKGLRKIVKEGKCLILDDGTELDCDMVLLSIGVRPNSQLAKAAGLQLNQRGGIVVDAYSKTSEDDIYAVGDVIEVENFVSKDKTMIPLAGPANKQGRAVCANVLGLEKTETYQGSMGTSIAKVFDLSVASTGLNEKALKAAGKVYGSDYFIALVHPMSHAGYYPGAMPMSIKLIFSKDKTILGAQIVGYDGVDKRIDSIATAIFFGGDIYDLTKLELAYAPPYSSAKDPVNVAGYYACDIYEGLSKPIRYEELIQNSADYKLIDVREPEELMIGKLEHSVNIPLSKLRASLSALDASQKYVVYCAVGLRGYLSERILRSHGFEVYNLLGGYKSYAELSQTFSDMTNEVDTNSNNPNPLEKKTIASDKMTNPLQNNRQDEVHDIGRDENRNENQDEIVRGNTAGRIIDLDVCGLSCPGPIVKVAQEIQKIDADSCLRVYSTDPGFARDIAGWCSNTGHSLVEQSKDVSKYIAIIRKNTGCALNTPNIRHTKEKTMIVFSGDLDKAIASFIIANGAAAMGNQVNMFFTFWGLNILRKSEHIPVKKDFISRMFSIMMPRGSKKLKLSQMSFLGAGGQMIRGIMKKHNVPSLEELIKQAIDSGVKISACQMSMDLMGIRLEELIDGVEVAGVATMLDDNDRGNMNLFI